MEEDGEPGVEQPEEVKKKKRVCTLHTYMSRVLYSLSYYDGRF